MYFYREKYSALVIMQSKYWLILKNIQDALCPKIFSEGFFMYLRENQNHNSV